MGGLGLIAVVATGTVVFSTMARRSTVDATKEMLSMDASSSFTGVPSATSSNQIPAGRLRMVHDPIVKPGELALRVPVLMYHYVRDLTPGMSTSSRWLSVSPEHFRAQMQEVVDGGYHAITPDELDAALNGKATLPAKPVMITFDDGYRDQYENAFPMLKTLGLRATFFIITGYINHNSPVYVTPEMVKEMDASSVATIGAHTKHHPELAKLKRADQKDEIVGSKAYLESLLHHPVTSFAYPYGSYDDAVLKIVTDAGFHTAFTTLLGSVQTSSTRLELRRIRVLDDEHVGPILQKFGSNE